MPPRKNIFPLVLILVSLIVQFYFLFSVFDPGGFFYKYWELAQRLRGEIAPPLGVFYSSPLYTVLLAVAQELRLTPFDVQVLQSFLGAVNCLLIYLAGRVFFDRRTGVVASLMAAVGAPFIIYNSALLPTVWLIAFNLVALLLLARYAGDRKVGSLVAAGVALGLSVITHPTALVFLICVILYLMFRQRSGGDTVGSPRLRGSRITATAAVVLPVLLMVLPVAMYNYRSSGEIIPLSASGGWVFYSANNERARGFDFSPPPEFNTWLSAYYAAPAEPKLRYLEHILALQLARARTGQALTHLQASKYWREEGFRFILGNPSAYLGLLGKKLLASANGYEPHDVPEVLESARRAAPYPLLPLRLLLPLAFLGLVVGRPRIGRRLLYFYLGSYLITFLIMYVIPRYRLPVVPVLLLFAAAALFRLIDLFGERRWRPAAGSLLLLILFGLLANLRTPDIAADETSTRPAFLYEWKGLTLLSEGKRAEAAAAFRQALALNPGSTLARHNLKLIEP